MSSFSTRYFGAALRTLVLGAALFQLACVAPAGAWASEIRITISGMKFNPEVVQAKVGDELVWENQDIVPHTVTSSSRRPSFDSGSLNSGQTFKLKIKKAGKIAYYCRFHPTMKAKIDAK